MSGPDDSAILKAMTGGDAVPRLAESVTPPGELAAGVRAIVAAWNASIPRNRVRVLAVYRLIALRFLLHRFTADQVVEAIRFYAAQRWQREHNAWKSFDQAMTEQWVTQWLEQAEEAGERREAAEQRRRQARQQQTDGDAAERRAAADLRARFLALPPDRQARYKLEAETLPAYLRNTPERLLNLAIQAMVRAERGKGECPISNIQ